MEEEGGDERRRSETGDDAVEPHLSGQAAGVQVHRQHHTHVGERVEAEVEDIGEQRRGRSAASVNRKHEVTDGPRHHANAEHQRHQARQKCPIAPHKRSADAERAAEQLEAGDAPLIHRGPAVGVPAQHLGDEVGDHQDRHHRVEAFQRGAGVGHVGPAPPLPVAVSALQLGTVEIELGPDDVYPASGRAAPFQSKAAALHDMPARA